MTDTEIQSLRDELEDAKKTLVDANDSIEALSNKNREIIMKNKKLSNQDNTIDIDEHYKTLDEIENLKADNKKLEFTLKGKDKDITKLNDTNTGLNSNLHGLLAKDELTKSLTKVGVKPIDIEIITDHLATKATIENIDGSLSGVIDGRTIDDYVSSVWAEQDGSYGGKNRIVAPTNSGSGGQGGNGGGNTDSKKYFDKSSPDFNLTKQGEISKSDPSLYAQLSK